jgi:hypothetical protein
MSGVRAFAIATMVLQCSMDSAQALSAHEIEMFPGLVRLLVLDARCANLAVASDAITVVQVGEKSVSIAAQKPVSSSIIFGDEGGRLVGRAEVTVMESGRAGRDKVTITRGLHARGYLSGGLHGWCIAVAPVEPPVSYNCSFFTPSASTSRSPQKPPLPERA